MVQRQGTFIISLDFELGWGLHDVNTNRHYDENILAVHKVVPEMLKLFQRYDIHATWATVGALFAKSVEELKTYIPAEKPSYDRPAYAPYPLIEQGNIKAQDARYFAPHLIEQVKQVPHQEMATHTFSHYYCLERGQTSEQFREDIKAAIEIGKTAYTSIVFPRNQTNPQYLKVCESLGIRAYRGNTRHPLYAPHCYQTGWKWRRILLIIDTYLNLTGHHTFSLSTIEKDPIYNIPASAFLRPYHRKMHLLERLRIRRIKRAMTYAAKNNEAYHLWWHPHNLGKHTARNFAALEEILAHYEVLNKRYGFQSKSMQDVVDSIENQKGED